MSRVQECLVCKPPRRCTEILRPRAIILKFPSPVRPAKAYTVALRCTSPASQWFAPDETLELLGRIADSLYLDVKTGQLVELVPRPGFPCVFEGAGITRPLATFAGDHQLTLGDSKGDRLRALQRLAKLN
jgi:hypothetical protein